MWGIPEIGSLGKDGIYQKQIFESDWTEVWLMKIGEEARRSKKTFKFEAWWVLEESFEAEVKAIWESSLGDFVQKLDKLKIGLGNWAKQTCMARKRNNESLNLKLSKLLEAERSENNLAELIDTKLHLNLEIDKDERYWEQRARVNCLRLGDKNITFFHNYATQRRQ
ncbi:endonuclease/exonuclease/phosphatase family protein [Gossypium australe]|uniref:Endonuclease/exonuclease/phosphatase family protein n=1 Tax=Gossypium australe TaxID=47621 RepID=A0A5B6V7J2_9ROSI|nr:endonuclease/exonuclease/phosphatase family protein [Gossypium australe]